jgi:hypothetical protein
LYEILRDGETYRVRNPLAFAVIFGLILLMLLAQEHWHTAGITMNQTLQAAQDFVSTNNPLNYLTNTVEAKEMVRFFTEREKVFEMLQGKLGGIAKRAEEELREITTEVTRLRQQKREGLSLKYPDDITLHRLNSFGIGKIVAWFGLE